MRRGWVLLVVLVPLAVVAHVGVQIAIPKFTNPAGPVAAPSDGGLTIVPFKAAVADTSYTVKWNISNPSDPTGRLGFYYLDHQPVSQIASDVITQIATPIPSVSGDNAEWISCDCNGDAGVVCPDAGPRAPHCGNLSFVFDTSGLPAGVYWLIAVNDDPPTKIYATSEGPLRVAHGGAAPPPAVVVILPDNLGAWDKTYRTLWTIDGTPPFKVDLYYGVNDPAHALDAPQPLALNLTPIMNADGTQSYDWDVSQLPEGLYYLRVKVTDGTGQTTFSDSYLGLTVYHPPVMADDGGIIFTQPDLSAPPDLSAMMPPPKPAPDGCSMAPGGGAAAFVGSLALALLVLLFARRQRSP